MFDPLDFKLTSLKNLEFLSELPGHQPVWCISPLTRRPVMDTFHEVWFDTNILSQSTLNPNISALMKVIERDMMGVSLIPALAELHRGHQPMEAGDLMLDKVPRFERHYGILFNIPEVTHQSASLPLYKVADNAYVKQLADMLMLIKYFYNKGGLDFYGRLKGFAKVVCAHLPYFAVTFYVACMYFLAKDRKDLFGEAIKRKIDSDMTMYPDASRNHLTTTNLASDLALITQSSGIPVTRPPTRFRIPYIATSDKGLALLLREICYIRIKINPQGGVGSGYPAFRAGGVMYSNCPSSAWDVLNEYLRDVPFDRARQIPLDQFARAIAEGTFDHRKV